MIYRFSGEYRWLSNFWNSPLVVGGRTISSVEHAFQACKTENPLEQATVLNAPTPGDAKKLGKRVTLRKDWDSRKRRVMKQLVTLKFTQNENLKEKLLVTGEKELVEGNRWHDTYWGVCVCDRCGNKGRNILGKILMEVRAELRK